MRNLRTRLTRSRRARRVSLAIIILAATPAFADHPQGHMLRMMPPLPLQAISSNTVHNNPFCAPELQIQDIPIQLTSGSKSVQLKPIDGTIGLHAIKKTEADRGALTIEPAAVPAVRSNPLVESKHRENNELIETRVLDSGENPELAEADSTVFGKNPPSVKSSLKAANKSVSRNSSIVLVEPSRKVHAAPADSPVAKFHLDSESVETTAQMKPVTSEPVLFSLTDLDSSRSSTTSDASETKNCPENSPSCEGTPKANCDREAPDSEVGRNSDLPAPISLSTSGDDGTFSDVPEMKTHNDSAHAQPLAARDSTRDSGLPAPKLELPATSLAQTQPDSDLELPITLNPVEMSEEETDVAIEMHLENQAEVAFAEPILFDPPVRSVTVTPAPAVTPAQPAITNEQPAITNEQPAITNEQPAITNEQPAITNERPAIAHDQPDIDQPAIANAQPAITNAQPTITNAQPTITNAQPSIANAQPSIANAQPSIANAQPAIANAQPAIANAQPAIANAQPAITEAQPAAIYRSGSTTARLKDATQTKLHDQRFRPPVSVTAVPISINRNEGDVAPSDSPATVEQVEEVALDRPAIQPERKAVVTRNTKLTPLFMKSAQVRSLTVAGELKNVRIGDKAVCQAVASGPNQLKLIGTGTGVTQLVVWAKTDDPDQPIRMRAFEVHVDQVDPAVQAGGSTAVMLNESIRDAFPGCRVTFSQNGGELIVSGHCDSEKSAEKIIRMIRKTCLVPVQDQLVVR